MHKILGYLLICIGLLLVFFSLVSMYKVFVDRQPAAPVVQLTDIQLQTQYGPMNIPMKNTNTIANLGLFALFMLFILSAGNKLAGLGISMLKNERIHDALLSLNDKDSVSTEDSFKKL